MIGKTEKAKRREERKNGTEPKSITPDMVAIKCVFPPCKERVIVKAPPEGVTVGTPAHMQTLGGIPMCATHGDMLGFMIWFQTNIKMQPQQTPRGLIVPGHQQFNPTLKGTQARHN